MSSHADEKISLVRELLANSVGLSTPLILGTGSALATNATMQATLPDSPWWVNQTVSQVPLGLGLAAGIPLGGYFTRKIRGGPISLERSSHRVTGE